MASATPNGFWERSKHLTIGLLLDSRVVDVPMSYNPIGATRSSVKPFLFNGLQEGGTFSEPVGAYDPGIQ